MGILPLGCMQYIVHILACWHKLHQRSALVPTRFSKNHLGQGIRADWALSSVGSLVTEVTNTLHPGPFYLIYLLPNNLILVLAISETFVSMKEFPDWCKEQWSGFSSCFPALEQRQVLCQCNPLWQPESFPYPATYSLHSSTRELTKTCCSGLT